MDAIQIIVNATGDDLCWLLSWRVQVDADINKQNEGADQPIIEQDDNGRGCLSWNHMASSSTGELGNEASEASLPGVDPSKLRTDQCQAHNIIIWYR